MIDVPNNTRVNGLVAKIGLPIGSMKPPYCKVVHEVVVVVLVVHEVVVVVVVVAVAGVAVAVKSAGRKVSG